MSRQEPLIPRAPRRMRQPRKDQLRDELARVTEENIRLRAELDRRTPWWQRLIRRIAA